MNIQKLTFYFILKLSECLATPLFEDSQVLASASQEKFLRLEDNNVELFENSQVLKLEQPFELIEGEDFWQKNASLEDSQDLFQSFSSEESQDILTPPPDSIFDKFKRGL